LCIHFTRNLAYYRAVFDINPEVSEGGFWTTVAGNSVDTAVLEWCKLFGERDGNHSWQRISDDHEQFRTNLKAQLGVSTEQWQACREEIRSYRDAFVAHLDDELTMDVPKMALPMKMVAYYYDYVLTLGDESFLDFPVNLYEYYDQMYQDAVSYCAT
jgi:hypothetical protein